MSDFNEDEIQVNDGRKVGVTVSLRLRPDEAEILGALSRRYDLTMSDTLRLGLSALARASSYSTLRVQSSGLGGFTRTEARNTHELVTA